MSDIQAVIAMLKESASNARKNAVEESERADKEQAMVDFYRGHAEKSRVFADECDAAIARLEGPT